MTATVYNGSEVCRCGRLMTPVEVMFGDLCPACTAQMVRQLIAGKMTPAAKPIPTNADE